MSQMQNSLRSDLVDPRLISGEVRDMTGANVDGLLTQRGGVNIQFYYVKTKLESPDPTINGQVVTQLCIAKMPFGDPDTVSHAVIPEEWARRLYPAEFAKFKENDGFMPPSGTPLQDLPGVSQSQIAILWLNGIRSVEDLARLPEDVLSRAGMEVSRAGGIARRWIENRDKNAETIKLVEVEQSFTKAMAEMARKVEALEARNAELAAAASRPAAPGAAPGLAGFMQVGSVARVAEETPPPGEDRYMTMDGPDVITDLGDPLAE